MRPLITFLFSLLALPVFAQSFPVTLDHAMGATILDKPAERIVVVSEEFIEVVIAMDVAPVGVGLWRNTFGAEPFTKLPYLDKPIPGAPTPFSAQQPDIELVLSLEPDLIFLHLTAAEGQDALYAQFAQVAPTIGIVGSVPGSWKELATDIGLATGKTDFAAKLIADFEARVTALQAEMAPIAAAYPTVTAVFGMGDSSGYFDERFSVGGHFALLGLTIVSPLGDAVPASGFGVASAESVAEIDADTIFVIRGGASPFDPLLELRSQPVLEVPLPKGIGHSGPYAEMLYLEAIAAQYKAQYGQ